MKNYNFLLLALLTVSVTFLVAFKSVNTENRNVYEYVSVIHASYGIVISHQGKVVERVKTKLNDEENFNPVYEILNKYEAAGWELFSNNMSIVPKNDSQRNYFLLRRKRE